MLDSIFWAHGFTIFVQYEAGVWRTQRKSTIPRSTSIDIRQSLPVLEQENRANGKAWGSKACRGAAAEQNCQDSFQTYPDHAKSHSKRPLKSLFVVLCFPQALCQMLHSQVKHKLNFELSFAARICRHGHTEHVKEITCNSLNFLPKSTLVAQCGAACDSVAAAFLCSAPLTEADVLSTLPLLKNLGATPLVSKRMH